MRSFLVVVIVILRLATIAHAEDIAPYDADGDADASSADARSMAVDDALGRAVSAALADVLDSDIRKANRAVIDRELIGHARLWVAGFKVTKDETSEGRRQLSVTARVDRDKMRARLTELSIGTAGPGELPGPGARTGIVLLRVLDGASTRADYGATAEKDLPGLGALSSTLRTAGITLKRAPTSGAAARPTGDLPLDDDQAEAYANEAKVEVAAIAGVFVGVPVTVRGVAGPAVLVTAHLRVLGRGKKLVGESVASVAARGRDASVVNAAIDRALVAAMTDVMPPAKAAQPGGFQGDDSPIAEPGVVLVRLSPKTPYALVAAELKYLVGAKGVTRAVLRRMSPAGWVIGVTTAESPQKIANIAKKPPATGMAVQVKVVGEIVEVGLTVSP